MIYLVYDSVMLTYVLFLDQLQFDKPF